MASRFQFRRDTAANWTSTNPILAQGELGLELGTSKYKIGDGATAWNTLAYGGVSLASTTNTDLDMLAIANPANPAAGRMKFYSHNIAGRMLPKIVGPSGLDVALQPFYAGNSIRLITPSATTAFSVLNMVAPTVVGTASTPAITAGVFRTQCRRTIITSAATANAASEIRTGQADVYRGDAAGLGGFHMTTTFGIESTTSLQRVAVGLWNVTTATATTQSPSSLINGVWVGWDSADTTLQVMSNDATGTATKIALSANFPVNNTSAMYEVTFFCPPFVSWIGYRVKRLDADFTASGTLTTDIPAQNMLLSWHAYMNNGGTAAAVVLAHTRTYMETDN